jgi:hypothetical protein
VVYAAVKRDEDRGLVAERLQHECVNGAMEGWRFVTAVADVDEGSTRGMWLFFAGDAGAECAELAAVEEMLEAR